MHYLMNMIYVKNAKCPVPNNCIEFLKVDNKKNTAFNSH